MPSRKGAMDQSCPVTSNVSFARCGLLVESNTRCKRPVAVAIPTYFMAGSRPLPSSIQTRLQTSPELVKNLVFLGKAGTLSTEGITIGFVGGVVTDDVDAVSAARESVVVLYSRPLAVLGRSGVAKRYRHHAPIEYSRQILAPTRRGKHAGGYT